MTLSSHARPLVDYLKFILPYDYDRAQQEVAPTVAAIKGLAGIEVPTADVKLTVLGPTESSGGRSRYVVECWGKTAHYALTMVPKHWYERLARIDARYQLTSTPATALGAFINRNILQANSKKNVTTFDTRSRQKTNTRDVGGRGIVFGSRKSDIHTAIYARGSEPVALEVRFQGRKADHIGNLALFEHDTSETGRLLYDAIIDNLMIEAMNEVYKITGATTIASLERIMDNDYAHSLKVNQAIDWLETEQERTWWESLTPEEQEQWQKDGFVPTEMLRPKTRD